jgi:E3 ubiquitin-protein ligase MARCH1/8
MVGCAIATIMCFLSDKGRISNLTRNKASLTTEEIVTLSCGVLFFVSFFIAMSVQIKAKHTIYQLFVKFIMQNMQWEIDQYDKRRDSKLFRNTKGSTSSSSYV